MTRLTNALTASQALRAVHQQGLVHCDIKDDNIMWDQATDTVQLIDFEVLRLLIVYSTCNINAATVRDRVEAWMHVRT